jgi:GT2 family glycosyltransferase
MPSLDPPGADREAGPHVRPAPSVSVCIVTARRPVLLDACLASLQAQSAPPPFELLVCCNGDAGAADVVRARFPDAIVGVADSTSPAAARNFLVQRACGELLLFLDDDVVAHTELLGRLVKLAASWPRATVFGGPNETPPGSSRFQLVQGAVLASIVGSGPVRRRYGRHPAAVADQRFFTLCNLAIRREAMLPFPPDLVCAEENVVLSELSRRGAVMRYDPGLVVFHERRPDVATFLSQVFGYGRGRGQLLTRAPHTFRPSHALPVMLVGYLAVLPLSLRHGRLWLVPLGAYLVAVTAAGARVAWTLRRPQVAPLATALCGGLHVWYGAGIVAGLVSRRRPERRASGFRWLDDDVLRVTTAPDRQA